MSRKRRHRHWYEKEMGKDWKHARVYVDKDGKRKRDKNYNKVEVKNTVGDNLRGINIVIADVAENKRRLA